MLAGAGARLTLARIIQGLRHARLLNGGRAQGACHAPLAANTFSP